MSTLQKHLCILVVDDDSDHASSLSTLLENYDYETHVCIDARKCMASVKRVRPDVVLLDLGMPGMSGYEIADQIRNTPGFGHIRLVAITGHGLPLDRLQTQMRGFDQHLLKPIDFWDLETILKSVQDRDDE